MSESPKPEQATLRFARKEDDIQGLWQLCFPGSEDRLYFEREYKPENTLVVASSQGVLAMAHLLTRTLQVEDSTVPMGYIFGVGTHPQFRRMGYGGGLIEQALFEFYLRNVPVASLITGNSDMIPYYQKFGFAVSESPGFASAEEIRKATVADIPQLSGIYDKSFPCRVKREEKDWRLILELYDVALTSDGYTVCSGGKLLEGLPATAKKTPPERPPAMVRIVRTDWLYARYPEMPPHRPGAYTPWNKRTAQEGAPSAEYLFLQKHCPYINLLYN